METRPSARETKTGGKLAMEALKKMPSASTMAIAKHLRGKYPAVFLSVNAARATVRYHRGERAGKDGYCKPRQRTKQDAMTCRKWGSLIPDAEQSTFRWHDLPADVSRWLIVCDIHVPYHDKAAVQCALEHADGNCDGVLINGDGTDAYQLSHWMRDPTQRRFKEEVDAWCQMLDAFSEIDGVNRIVWKGGNHELRLERYLMQRAPELFGMEQFTWANFCGLQQRNIEWVPEMNPVRHGDLTILHGHEWGNRFSSPVNPARGAFLKAHDCTIEGHGHRTSHHTEHTLRGRPISCWSIGCLCDLNPLYRPLGNKWNSGFAYLNAGHEWTIENHRIIDGKVV